MLELTFEDEVSDEQYFKQKALNQSTIKRLLSGETYEVANDIQTEETNAMRLGTLIHAMILEPHTVDKRFAVLPQLDLRTKADKEFKATFELEYRGRIIISWDDWETAKEVQNAFAKNTVAKLIKNGDVERAFNSTIKHYTVDGEDVDVPIKGKLDFYSEDLGIIADIKSTQTSGDKFVKECADRLYNVQSAFYFDLLQSLGLPTAKFIFIGVQTKKPYKITIVEVPQNEIETGREFYKIGIDIWLDMQANMDRYKKELVINPADGTNVFQYETPTWMYFKMEKLKKQRG
jgi:exodeoxyribonuclease VIII